MIATALQPLLASEWVIIYCSKLAYTQRRMVMMLVTVSQSVLACVGHVVPTRKSRWRCSLAVADTQHKKTDWTTCWDTHGANGIKLKIPPPPPPPHGAKGIKSKSSPPPPPPPQKALEEVTFLSGWYTWINFLITNSITMACFSALCVWVQHQSLNTS